MSRNSKPSKPHRPLFGDGSWWNLLWDKVKSGVGSVKGKGERALADMDTQTQTEPIDFSTPSIPYYINLADKFHLARIVLYMVLFAFLVVTLFSSRQVITYENLYYLVKDINAAGVTAASQVDYLNYPLSQATPDFAMFRGGLVIAGGDEITVLSASGKQTLSDNVKLTRPSVSAGGQYFIVYSRDEKNFTVYNAFAKMRKELTEYPVYDACMGNDGSFGVLSRSMDYTSEVTWYNDDMSRLAACHIGGYVIDLVMSLDSRAMAVLSSDVISGAYESKVTILRRDGGGNVTYKEIAVSGACLGGVFLTEDALCVMTESGFDIYHVDGSLQSQMSFDGERAMLWGATTGYFSVLSQSKINLSQNMLKVFDKNGKLVYNVEVDDMETPSCLVMDGSDVYLLDAAHILSVSRGGERLRVAEVDRNTLTLLLSDQGELLALTPAFARYLNQADFTDIP